MEGRRVEVEVVRLVRVVLAQVALLVLVALLAFVVVVVVRHRCGLVLRHVVVVLQVLAVDLAALH